MFSQPHSSMESSFSHRRSVLIPNDSLGIENGTVGAVRFGQNNSFLAPQPPQRFQNPTGDTNESDSGPSFLFGNRNAQKRKSLALQSRAQANKSVHWSPNLVRAQETPQESGLGSAAPSLHRRATVAGPHSWNAPPASMVKGPPLRSMLNTEPPAKMQRVDQKAAIKEAFQFEGTSDDPADYWVTVFGFDPEHKDMILPLFSRHGTIASHKIPPKGNWLHIRYSSVQHAQQALQRNGFVLDQIVKIGVERCKDKEVLSDDTMNPYNTSTNNIPDVSFEGPGGSDTLNSSRFSLNQSMNSAANRSRLSAISRSGIRRAYDADTSLNTSKKDDSFLNKLWSFVAPQ
ncbi:unnamed protein product [Bursaphelenchus xylophilus]|uniref:Nucleoporin NUP53 n=1 Tax=Bursaphelenchus xylophilus TaxID=6326 RepID=A0A1I7S233_BURXY|nr:unnamed protein product [Bursaphelenchus xylophilus]CAG9114967.1 unnamed protein product [Bursaphelenchus xylophilus]